MIRSDIDTEPVPAARPTRRSGDTLEIPRQHASARVTPPAVPPSPPQPRARGMRPAGVALLLGAAAVAGVVVGAVGRDAPLLPERPAQAAAAPVTVESVTSVDPSGGSGFQATDGGGWRTQTYRTAEFGNLKEGVGLLVDLGASGEVATVTLEDVSPGVAVELRAGDERAADPSAYRVVDTVDDADQTTVLEAADAGASRYWLVWVTGLAPSGGGFAAEIGDVAVTATAG